MNIGGFVKIFLVLVVAGLVATVGTQAQSTGGEVHIASCKVLNAGSQDVSAAQVFQENDANKSIRVLLTLPTGPQSFLADSYQFFPDGKVLQIRVAKFISMTVLKGRGTTGKMGVALGAPPSDMVCNANW
jgi:hypothetical protein